MKAYVKQVIGGRAKQEDRFLALQAAIPETHEETALFAVADGIGRLERGEVASRVAIRELKTWFLNEYPLVYEAPFGSLFETITSIQILLKEEGQKNEGDSGTTLTLCFIRKNQLTCLWLGDSRAFLIRDDEIKELTKEHKVFDEKSQKWALEKACTSFGITHNPDKTGPLDLENDDKILLCTDGALSNIDLEDLLDFDSSEIPAALIELSEASGNRDNKTALLIDLGEDD